MTFYIFYNQQDFDYYRTKNSIPEDHTIGQLQFSNFWTASGYQNLKKIIETGDNITLTNVLIVNSNYKIFKIEEFLDYITKYKIIEEWKQ